MSVNWSKTSRQIIITKAWAITTIPGEAVIRLHTIINKRPIIR